MLTYLFLILFAITVAPAPAQAPPSGPAPSEPYASIHSGGPAAFDGQGSLLAFDAYHGVVKVWDVAARKEIASINADKDRVLAVSLSLDGLLLAIAGRGSGITIWETKSGRLLQTLKEPPRYVLAVQLSADGRWLAFSDEKRVKLWDTKSGQNVATFETEYVRHLAFSPDGKWFAWADGALWELATGKSRALPGSCVSKTVAFSHDSRLLAVACDSRNDSGEGAVDLWEVAAGNRIRRLSGTRGRAAGLAFSADGRWLTAVANLSTVGYLLSDRDPDKVCVKAWEVETGNEAVSSQWKGSISSLSPDGGWLAGEDQVWRLKGLQQPEAATSAAERTPKAAQPRPAPCVTPSPGMVKPELVIQSGHSRQVLSIAFSPDGCWLASLAEEVILWELPVGRQARVLPAPSGEDAVTGDLAFTPDSRWLALPTETGVRLWEVASGREDRLVLPKQGTFRRILFSSDGRWLASWCKGGSGPQRGPSEMTIWEFPSRREVARLPHGSEVQSAAFTPDNRRLLSGDWDGTVREWDLQTGRLIEARHMHDSAVASLAVSADGGWAASGTTFSGVKLWELGGAWNPRTVAPESKLSGDAVAFSPDSRLLAVGNVHGTKLFEIPGGQEKLAVEGSTQVVAFTPDGRSLLTAGWGSGDPRVQLWDVASGRLLQPELAAGSRLAISQDGRWVASPDGVDAASIRLRELQTGVHIQTLARRTAPLQLAGYTGKYLLTGPLDLGNYTRVRDYASRLWDTSAGLLLHHEELGYSLAVAASPDGKWLAKGRRGSVQIADLATNKPVRELATGIPKSSPHLLRFSNDSRILVIASHSPYDPNAYDCEPYRGGGSPRKCVPRLPPSGLATWEVAKDTSVRTVPTDRLTGGLVAAVAPPGAETLFYTDYAPETDQKVVREWSLATGQQVRWFVAPFSTDFSDDGSLAVGEGIDRGGLSIWDVARGRQLRVLSGHFPMVSRFSPDLRWLASPDGKLIRLWEVATGKELRSFSGHLDEVDGVAFGPGGRRLLSSSMDNTIRIWDTATGAELALLCAVEGTDDWLIVTPEGYFDGSSAGMQKLVVWRFGAETAPLEAYFNEFYYPGLLAEILAGRRPKPPRDLAQLDRRQPRLQFSLASDAAQGAIDSRTVVIKIKVGEAPADQQFAKGSGARDVRLFRNGSLVRIWRGNVLNGRSEAALEATVPIVAGRNRFTAYAFNNDNIKSADEALVVTGGERLRRKGTAYIIAIGIDRYANPDYNLKYAVADSQAFMKNFAAQQNLLGNYERVRVVSLVDDAATKGGILSVLSRLAAGAAPAGSAELGPAEPEDAVILYYAGHGTAAGPRFYLIPHDLGYTGKRESLDAAGLQSILQHGISDRELEQAFEKIDAGRIVLVIDACNSGQALEAEEKRRGPMNSKGLAQLAFEKGMYILTAAQGYQAALEATELGHGYLTYALVEEGLKTAVADVAPRDGQLTVREWLDYATLRVPQMQEQGMEEARKLGRELAVVDGEEKIRELARRSLQRPRVFYRREAEPEPLIVARP
jgi:WD40 repeat protein